MVYFTCNSCGTSIKKNQVATHKFRCRNGSVSCIDCGKDFWGNDYDAHTKCISEQEKYSGKNFVPKPNANKGQKKADEWMECLEEILKTKKLKPKVRSMIEQLTLLNNVPRKQKQFENFIHKSLKLGSYELINETWNVISETMESMKSAKAGSAASESKPPENGNKQEEEAQTNGKKQKKERKNKDKQTKENGCDSEIPETGKDEVLDSNVEQKQIKTKKRKRDLTNEQDKNVEVVAGGPTKTKKPKLNPEVSEPIKTGKFKWKKAIVTILSERQNHELSFKKLRKKIVAHYTTENNGELNNEDVENKIRRAIEKSSKISIENERVKLINE